MRVIIFFIFLFLIPEYAKTESHKIIEKQFQNQPYLNEELSVELNLHNGKVLMLNDGSIWEVAPQSLSISQSWIVPSPLNIEESNHAAYPYKITNTISNSFIFVRPISD